jgi:chromosomal replication initiation ATPase DnaA
LDVKHFREDGMTLALFDIVNARLDAIAYQRVQDSLRHVEENKRTDRLIKLCVEHASQRGFSVRQYFDKGRTHELSKARQDFMDAAYSAGFTLTEIAKVLGGRDHTTILHGIRAARKRRDA